MSPSVKAAAYIRRSTDMREVSSGQQEREIATFAHSPGYEITERFVAFCRSGTTFEHGPEFQQPRKYVEEGALFRGFGWRVVLRWIIMSKWRVSSVP